MKLSRLSFAFPLVVCALLAGAPPARSAPGEVQNLRVEREAGDDPECLIWDIQTSDGYHVYRGQLAAIPGDYGTCLLGSVPGELAEIAEDPAPGEAFTYLVTAFDATGEGTAGTDSGSTERFPSTPCVPARRIFAATPDGDPGDGVEDGRYPLRNSSLLARSSSRERVGVHLHTGELTVSSTDLALRGRGLDWALSRTYRSQVAYDGPMGRNWEGSFNARLVPLGIDALHFDGSGREERFFRVDSTHFDSPPGRYAVLSENADGSFVLRDPRGTRYEFHAFDASNVEGVLEGVEDRNGNRISFLYDHQGLLVSVVESLGREIGFAYDASGRLTSVTDFSGRTVVYAYDAAGRLTSARTPTVTGTPNGNDFPAGKTTRYAYSSGFADPRLVDDLLSITSPAEGTAGPASVEVQYFDDTAPAFDVGRVQTWTIGGTNASGVPAGGTLTFSYESLNGGGDPADLALPRRRTTVVDRIGNQSRHAHNHPGNRIELVELTNREVRPGEPDYTTTTVFNADGEVVERTHPEGNRTQLTWDSPGLDRYREGNLLERREIADPLASSGRGDGHGSESNDLVWTYTYEPVYNRVASVTDPRGNDPAYVPQNGGSWSAARYRTLHTFDYEEGDPATNGIQTMAARFEIDLSTARSLLGDRNGDGRTDQAAGNLVRTDAPDVLLAASSNQAAIEGDTTQEAVTRRVWNDFGQPTSEVDAESNRHDFAYHPEDDPDGNGTATPPPADGRTLDGSAGGYLRSRIADTVSDPNRNNKTDPAPAMREESFRYDVVGNLTHAVDGRGILNRRVYNALDQVVEARRGAATSDAAGPDGDAATGRGETGLTPLSFKTRFEYDANDNLVAVRVEDRNQDRGVGPWVDVTYAYDILDRRIRETAEATPTTSLVTEHRYDANENPTSTTRPEGSAETWTYDERDLLHESTRGASGPRGGVASTRAYHYDANGNTVRVDDARGGRIDREYDGHDRLTRVVDQLGDTADLFWDPAGNRVRELARGTVSGPAPPDRTGATNVDLGDVEFRYDERSRCFRTDHVLFVPSGAAPGRPPVLVEGPAVPADGRVNQTLEFDRLSRTTFAIRDTGETWRHDYDGAGRLLRVTEPDGSTVESFHDGNDNAIESAATELSSASAVPSELFLTTRFYDAVDRLVRAVDNLGQTHRYAYDSLDALVLESDANGPPGPVMNRRSPPHAATSVATNLHGNVTRIAHDGLGRRVRVDRILTASGLGDGTASPPPATGDPNNPDGLLRVETQWDGNSLVAAVLDDSLHTTTYAYDNLDRRISETRDDGTVRTWSHDPEDNLTGHVDANGTSFTGTYDAANRTILVVATPATGLEGTTQQSFEYDGLGRVTRTTDNNDPSVSGDDAEVVRVYDSLGRVVEEKQTLGSTGGTALVDYRWLGERRITDVVYPSGRRIAYAYDAAGRTTSVTDPSRSESASYVWFGMRGRWHTRSYGNGVRATMLDDAGTADTGFDGVARVVSMRHLDGGNALRAGFEHGYDRAGNRLHELRLHDQDVASGGVRGELWAFDSGNRLIDSQEAFLNPTTLVPTGPVSDAQVWSRDGVGNWVTMTRNGVPYTFTPSNNNEYDEDQTGGTRTDDGVPDDTFDDQNTPTADGRNQVHDAQGNTTGEGAFTIVYDAWDRPVRVVRDADGMTVVVNRYDAFGRRVRMQVTNTGAFDRTRRFLYEPTEPVSKPGSASGWAKDKIGAAIDWVIDKIGAAADWPSGDAPSVPLGDDWMEEQECLKACGEKWADCVLLCGITYLGDFLAYNQCVTGCQVSKITCDFFCTSGGGSTPPGGNWCMGTNPPAYCDTIGLFDW